MNWWWLIAVEYAVLGIGTVVVTAVNRRRERKLLALLAEMLTPRIADPSMPLVAELQEPEWIAPYVRERSEP